MRRYPPAAGVFFLITLLSSCLSWQAARAACHEFSDILHTGGYALADESGRIVSSCNRQTSFIPASIIKIPTALAAMHILGRGFRFRTAFYRDNRNNLYIEASGDPFLISEEVAYIIGELQAGGVNEIRGIFVDISRFALREEPPGMGRSDNPYDSPATAAGVNFNTVSIRVDEQGNVVSDEPQTPTLPIMAELGAGLPRGSYRLNICRPGCAADEQAARYTAELFRGLQDRAGIAGSGPLGIRQIPADAELVYTHANRKNLEQIVASLLEYSNNYTANMVFLACGMKQYGDPATWDKARKAVQEALANILGADTAMMIGLHEGSGLARSNRITAEAVIRSLVAFREHRNLLQEKQGHRIKSGTLDGVYNYAGYLDGSRPFVILLNQPQNTRDAVLRRLDRMTARLRGESGH